MKHQVFLLLLFYSFSVYSMDPSKVSKEQIIAGLMAYQNRNQPYLPDRFNWQGFGQAIENINNKDHLSDTDKREILQEMSLLPAIIPLGDKLILLEQYHEAIK